VIAKGIYSVYSRAGGPSGTIPWTLEADSENSIRILAKEHLDWRDSWFEGLLNSRGDWKGTSESCRWKIAEGEGIPETHNFEMFFHKQNIYLLRLRDRAYPFLQRQPVAEAPLLHLVNYPIVATTWLRPLTLEPGLRQRLSDFVHIGHRYRGAFLELQVATAEYLGKLDVDRPGGNIPGHHFILSYPGGWVDSTFEYWTDMHFIPVKARINAGEGELEYQLTHYELVEPARVAALLSK